MFATDRATESFDGSRWRSLDPGSLHDLLCAAVGGLF
jgi:hypothetical protein